MPPVERPRRAKVIIVTGAAGYIGRSVTEWLIGRGHTVVAHARRPSRWVCAPADTIFGDLRDEQITSEIVERADVVIHCAARVRDGSREDFDLDNVRVTGRLSGARRLIHLSTVAIYGHRTQHLADESTALRPEDDYSRSKAESERAAGENAIVLRLGPVFGGPHDDRFVAVLQKALRLKVVAFPGPCCTPLPLLHIHNLSQAIEAALDADVCGRRFNLTDDRAMGLRAFVDELATVGGYSYTALTIPIRLAQLGAKIGSSGLALLGKGSPLRPEIIELMNTSVTFDLTAARASLGYRPERHTLGAPSSGSARK
jgi:nucleoside-diphosphate-sugar epimerase